MRFILALCLKKCGITPSACWIGLFGVSLSTTSLATIAASCPITEHGLISGGWMRDSATGFFAEMSFEIYEEQRIFNSWLHQRPEFINATWTFQDCNIQINHPTEPQLNFTFELLKATKKRIYLREKGDSDIAIYRNVRP